MSQEQNLYQRLGVRRNARPETIKKAFRRLAKTAHPDVGGNRVEFDRLHQAYAVLMDADLRAKYDLTGEINPQAADNAAAKILSMVVWAFDCVVDQVVDQGADVAKQDIIDLMRQALNAKIKEGEKVRRANDKKRGQYQKLVGRFKVRRGEPNRLQEIAQAKIAGVDELLARLSREETDARNALEFLDAYSFDQDVMSRVVAHFGTSTSTATASTGF